MAIASSATWSTVCSSRSMTIVTSWKRLRYECSSIPSRRPATLGRRASPRRTARSTMPFHLLPREAERARHRERSGLFQPRNRQSLKGEGKVGPPLGSRHQRRPHAMR